MNELEPVYVDDFEKIRQIIEQARQEAAYKVAIPPQNPAQDSGPRHVSETVRKNRRHTQKAAPERAAFYAGRSSADSETELRADEPAAGQRRTVDTVSYTHLDVYKRQAIFRSMEICSEYSIPALLICIA